MLGNWIRKNSAETNRLVRLAVARGSSDRLLLIHAWGNCQPANCDWGAQFAPVVNGSASAVWPSVGANDMITVIHTG